MGGGKFKKLAMGAILANRVGLNPPKRPLNSGMKSARGRSSSSKAGGDVTEAPFFFSANATHRKALGVIPPAFDRLFTDEDVMAVKEAFINTIGGIKTREEVAQVLPSIGVFPSAEQLTLALQAIQHKDGVLLSLDALIELVKRLLWVQLCLEPNEEECVFAAMGGQLGKGRIKTEAVQDVLQQFDLRVDVAQSLVMHSADNSRASTPENGLGGKNPTTSLRLAALLRKSASVRKDMSFGEFEEMLESLQHAHQAVFPPADTESDTSRPSSPSPDSFLYDPTSPTASVTSPSGEGAFAVIPTDDLGEVDPFERKLRRIRALTDGSGAPPVHFIKPGCDNQKSLLTNVPGTKANKNKHAFQPIQLDQASPAEFAKLLAVHGIDALLRMTKRYHTKKFEKAARLKKKNEQQESAISLPHPNIDYAPNTTHTHTHTHTPRASPTPGAAHPSAGTTSPRGGAVHPNTHSGGVSVHNHNSKSNGNNKAHPTTGNGSATKQSPTNHQPNALAKPPQPIVIGGLTSQLKLKASSPSTPSGGRGSGAQSAPTSTVNIRPTTATTNTTGTSKGVASRYLLPTNPPVILPPADAQSPTRQKKATPKKKKTLHDVNDIPVPSQTIAGGHGPLVEPEEEAEEENNGNTGNDPFKRKHQFQFKTVKQALTRGNCHIDLCQPFAKDKHSQQQLARKKEVEANRGLLENIEIRAGLIPLKAASDARLYAVNQNRRLLLMSKNKDKEWKRIKTQHDKDHYKPDRSLLAQWVAARRKQAQQEQEAAGEQQDRSSSRSSSDNSGDETEEGTRRRKSAAKPNKLRGATLLETLLIDNEDEEQPDYDVLDPRRAGNSALLLQLKPHQLRSPEYMKFALRAAQKQQKEREKKRAKTPNSQKKRRSPSPPLPRNDNRAQTPNSAPPSAAYTNMNTNQYYQQRPATVPTFRATSPVSLVHNDNTDEVQWDTISSGTTWAAQEIDAIMHDVLRENNRLNRQPRPQSRF
eukprot:TRINITY_DN67289_c3_g1_i1.p1 TRINITY_DN67289_c3_g1~~TRINITY_DN67289_c3_g1_i1.p1  ORF type:complete len:1042 (+),score=90.80 TRINITY_DN67289_c3_g1_i1:176-3127(+)